ncbi:class D sortase [Virgibacillus natechei]|uniref:class D sortase n=1 Tax=Virgibacillus sp. CBA3643 TaxID=2942278 RepID=UPI0035A3CBBC
MKKLSILLIVAGIVILGFGGYELLQIQTATNDSLVEARALLDKSKTIENHAADNKLPSDDFNPTTGETTGILHIPKLASDLPIVEGTHEDELAKGVGHYSGTAYPQQDNQIVLSGHRDTVFRRMGELELGDILTIQLPYGDFSYEITETQIVGADDRSIIVPTGEEVLTLTTCYPFSYVGNAPDRYIITAIPISDNN